jgi:hypothetical protein
MRWAVLYARSRQVPAGTVGVLACTVGVWLLAKATTQVGPTTGVLAMVAGAGVLATGLSGQDVALDRTAAIRWWPRRAVHVLLTAAVTGAVLLGWQALTTPYAPFGFVVRDCFGLLGLAGLTATAVGAWFAWTVPFGWCTFALFGPSSGGAGRQVVTWMVQPGGAPAATWTAVVLGVTGTVCYAALGNRR